jgi:hypothetical protein
MARIDRDCEDAFADDGVDKGGDFQRPGLRVGSGGLAA